MKALNKLTNKNNEGKFVCVGLDTDIEKIPRHLLHEENPVVEFNKQIIESTIDHAAAYKINFAFYEKDGEVGLKNLAKTLELIPSDILTIADAKRGDIGNTSQMYAKEVFDYYKFDSITINPYMGEDSAAPFISYKEKLIFILALTSNKGASDFEKLKFEDGTYLFQKVIDKSLEWNVNNNCGLVFGATQLDELKENILRTSNMPLLIPGVGAQGGRFEDIVALINTIPNKNYIINISRGIIYKSSEKDFATKAREEIINYNNISEIVLNNKKNM